MCIGCGQVSKHYKDLCGREEVWNSRLQEEIKDQLLFLNRKSLDNNLIKPSTNPSTSMTSTTTEAKKLHASPSQPPLNTISLEMSPYWIHEYYKLLPISNVAEIRTLVSLIVQLIHGHSWSPIASFFVLLGSSLASLSFLLHRKKSWNR